MLPYWAKETEQEDDRTGQAPLREPEFALKVFAFAAARGTFFFEIS